VQDGSCRDGCSRRRGRRRREGTRTGRVKVSACRRWRRSCGRRRGRRKGAQFLASVGAGLQVRLGHGRVDASLTKACAGVQSRRCVVGRGRRGHREHSETMAETSTGERISSGDGRNRCRGGGPENESSPGRGRRACPCT
jgi:hypothetical protein